jgi:class 3 adenylate cyclase
MLDRIVREGGGVRVDFHAARLHFVVAEPVGAGFAKERVERALEIVEALEINAATTPASLGYSVARAPLRIGIDQGPCIAIANDSGHEMDPVFLGSPANYAAKLANGDTPGVFASDRVWNALGVHRLPGFAPDTALPGSVIARVAKSAGSLAVRARDQLLERKRLHPGDVAPPNFVFHRAAPPLGSLKFSDLQPSYTIRMEMASVFADLDNFTPFVDAALKSGAGREVVRAMFVIREEQRAVFKHDFGTKRLRFVGDCAIGLHAEGTAAETNAAKTVEHAVLCASALHNSLEICGQEMPSVTSLGLQIGVAYGITPITRLGIRGDMSVRCAASRSIMDAEKHQGLAERGETAVAPSALLVSARVRKVANSQRGAVKGSFSALETLLTGVPLALGAGTSTIAHASSGGSAGPFRAHGE